MVLRTTVSPASWRDRSINAGELNVRNSRERDIAEMINVLRCAGVASRVEGLFPGCVVLRS